MYFQFERYKMFWCWKFIILLFISVKIYCVYNNQCSLEGLAKSLLNTQYLVFARSSVEIDCTRDGQDSVEGWADVLRIKHQASQRLPQFERFPAKLWGSWKLETTRILYPDNLMKMLNLYMSCLATHAEVSIDSLWQSENLKTIRVTEAKQ